MISDLVAPNCALETFQLAEVHFSFHNDTAPLCKSTSHMRILNIQIHPSFCVGICSTQLFKWQKMGTQQRCHAQGRSRMHHAGRVQLSARQLFDPIYRFKYKYTDNGFYATWRRAEREKKSSSESVRWFLRTRTQLTYDTHISYAMLYISYIPTLCCA